jgi:hypothetical protein
MWVINLEIVKLPLMDKEEYDQLIKEQYLSRIAFKGDYPYIAPFMYVFDDEYLYFLSTKYGKKIDMLRQNPKVAVEIENYGHDLAEYKFVTLQGKIEQIEDEKEKIVARKLFIDRIKEKNLSSVIMAALGHRPDEPPEALLEEEKSYVWKLVDVKKIIGIKNS